MYIKFCLCASPLSVCSLFQCLHLLTWRELELRVCGRPTVDLSVLEKHTVYSGGYTRASPIIENFWTVLRDFTPAELASFLQFAWARSRLPADEAGQGSYRMQLNILDASASAKNSQSAQLAADRNDMLLPTSETCFFNGQWARNVMHDHVPTRWSAMRFHPDALHWLTCHALCFLSLSLVRIPQSICLSIRIWRRCEVRLKWRSSAAPSHHNTNNQHARTHATIHSGQTHLFSASQTGTFVVLSLTRNNPSQRRLRLTQKTFFILLSFSYPHSINHKHHSTIRFLIDSLELSFSLARARGGAVSKGTRHRFP